MRSSQYLNTVLTVIAVLLTMHLWRMWYSGPAENPWVDSAEAVPFGIPNASAQRQKIVNLMKQLNEKTGELTRLFQTGQAKVKIDQPKPQKTRQTKPSSKG